MRPLLVTSACAALLAAPAPLQAAPRPAAVAVAPSSMAATGLVLPPPKAGRLRPLVTVVADNAGAETTDFVVPYGVLKDSGVAEVRSLSSTKGPVRLFLSLKIEADQTFAEFDAAEPAGADIVIVPAQIHPKDPTLIAWIQSQAARGATIVSICEGARVLAAAGLLDGRRATSHWHALADLEKHYPATRWVRDLRYVQDGPIISTTGVSASVPASLALVEAIAGRPAASEVATRLGAADWSPEHRTQDYRISASDYAGALLGFLAFWRREPLQAPIQDGVDEIALALQADTWSRAFRGPVVTTHPKSAPVRSRHGLLLLPDASPKPGGSVLETPDGPPLRALDTALAGVELRYGARAARLARLGLEYAPKASHESGGPGH